MRIASLSAIIGSLLFLVTSVALSADTNNAPNTGNNAPVEDSAQDVFPSRGKDPDTELPPGSLPLSAIVTKLENAGYTPIFSVDYEDEVWVCEARKNGAPFLLSVDPVSGAIVSVEEIAQDQGEPKR